MKIGNHISPSALTDFSTCRLKWMWSRKLSRIKRTEYFELGTGVHHALEKYYAGMRAGVNVPLVKTFEAWAMAEIAKCEDPEDRATMNKVRVMGIAMLEGYTFRYPRQKETFDVIELEHHMERTIPGTDWVADVRIDGIVKHKRSQTFWGLENKTFGTFHEDFLPKSHQFAMEYWVTDHWAMTELGIHIDGIIYNGLRSQIPGPRVKNDLFERVYMTFTETQVRTVVRRLQDVVRQLSQGHLRIYPEPAEIQCNMCQFKEVCNMKLREEDYEFVLRSSFKEYVRDESEDLA